MVSATQLYAQTYLHALAGSDITLHGQLTPLFARILSGLLDINDIHNIQHHSAFAMLSKIFAFVATSTQDRPAAPTAYTAERIAAAHQAAQQALQEHCYLQQAQDNVPTQTLSGIDGLRDLFVFTISSDPNGPFGEFGHSIIEHYNPGDGDRILFIDHGHFWADTPAMLADTLPEVQPHDGNATILFNRTQSAASDPYATVQIHGASLTQPFGNTLADVENVHFSLITQAQITLAGGLQAYVTTHLADCH